MQPEKTESTTETTAEKIVIPLFEIVVFPDSRTKFPVDLATGDLLIGAMENENEDAVHAIGITVKSGTRPA